VQDPRLAVRDEEDLGPRQALRDQRAQRGLRPLLGRTRRVGCISVRDGKALAAVIVWFHRISGPATTPARDA
jgi:hypothetical protein